MAVLWYQDLIAWQKAMDLVVEVYRTTKTFPRDEIYALTNQIRRAAVSVPSNIAEGQGRGGAAEFARYLKISQGSLQELETQLLLAHRLEYLEVAATQNLRRLIGEVARLIKGLHHSICPSDTNN